MGLNAYFTYQVVGFHGTGPVSYRLALTAVFVEGFVFVFLSLIGMRQWLVKVIPPSIKVASGVGIGLFLTVIGMSYSAGIGLITGSSATPTDLGGCAPQYLDPQTGACTSHKMTNPTVCTLLLFTVIRSRSVDVDRNHVWRHVDCVPYVLPSKICYHHRHRRGLHPFVAASYFLPNS